MNALLVIVFIVFSIYVIAHPAISEGMIVLFIILYDPLGDHLVLKFLCCWLSPQPFVVGRPGNIQPGAQFANADILFRVFLIFIIDFLDCNKLRL